MKTQLPQAKTYPGATDLAKLRGTEAEIYARLRELTEEFRQLRRELSDTTHRRVTGGRGSETEKPQERSRAIRAAKVKPR